MSKSTSVSWAALRLFVLSLIISIAVGEIRMECVRDFADYTRGDYEWDANPFFTWKYAATADRLPSIFQGKLQGTGIFYADGADGTGGNSFSRDPSTPVPTATPGYLYIKYYIHRTNASDLYTYALPAKGESGLRVNLPITDDFRWQEQLIELEIQDDDEAYYVIGVINRNMTMGQYLLIDTIALIQGDIVSTTAEAAELCSQQPRAAPVPETWNPKMKPLLHH